MSDLNHQSESEVLERATNRLSAVVAPPGPPARLVLSTVEALNAASQSATEIQPSPKRPGLRRVIRFAAAAALVATTAGALLLLDRNATAAWAQVVENVRKARTVSFIVKQKFGDKPEFSSRMTLRETVLRYEIADALVLILDLNTRQEIELDTVRKVARKTSLEGRAPAEEIKSPIDRLRNLGKGEADKVTILGDEERDGVRCKVFEIDSPAAFPVGGKFKLWADAKTNLPIRIEVRDDQMSLVYESYRWDEALDDDLFRLEVPKGYLIDELSPAVVQPGRIYYHQGSTALSSLKPDGQSPETQFVPRAEAPATYASDRSELTPANGQGVVTYAPSCGAVTVDVAGLPALPDDRTYQLWALSDQAEVAPRSLGLLPQAAAGQSQVVTQTTRPGEVAVAVTAEPGQGSASPTMPIVWMTELA